MELNKENYATISRNENVLSLVARLLDRGDKLVVSNKPVGQYVCSCDLGVVQRVS